MIWLALQFDFVHQLDALGKHDSFACSQSGCNLVIAVTSKVPKFWIEACSFDSHQIEDLILRKAPGIELFHQIKIGGDKCVLALIVGSEEVDIDFGCLFSDLENFLCHEKRVDLHVQLATERMFVSRERYD